MILYCFCISSGRFCPGYFSKDICMANSFGKYSIFLWDRGQICWLFMIMKMMSLTGKWMRILASGVFREDWGFLTKVFLREPNSLSVPASPSQCCFAL